MFFGAPGRFTATMQIIAAQMLLRMVMERVIMRLKYGFLAVTCLFLVATNAAGQSKPYLVPLGVSEVNPGVDNLVAQHWAPLRGKIVGLITNQTGITKRGRPDPALFASSSAIKLKALFAPEHGITGMRQAGVESNTVDSFYGIPIYSLYGTTRKPTPEMLHGLTALVFDIQDIGVRPYTFISTMFLAMEAAAEQGIPFYVLDRPNPLSGERIEGNILDTTLKSFVGIAPIPYIHGMTIGELAQMAKAKGWFKDAAKLKLTVIPMLGWHRAMAWPQADLNWLAPSPNIPMWQSAVGCAMFGATGELGIVSVGVGTDLPFQRIGSNLLTSNEILRIADSVLPHELQVFPENFVASTNAMTKNYEGIRITVPPDMTLNGSLYEPQFRMLEAMLHNLTFRASFDALPQSVHSMFEKVTGMRGLAEMLERGDDLTPLFAKWKQDDEKFRKERQPYLLYK